MNLKYRLAQKTIVTPICENVEFNRNYVYNRKFTSESIDIINEALNKAFTGQKLSQTGVKFLKKQDNEDYLINLRNWAIYYIDNSGDYNEFDNCLQTVINAMMFQ